jgi:hypothetical protein
VKYDVGIFKNWIQYQIGGKRHEDMFEAIFAICKSSFFPYFSEKQARSCSFELHANSKMVVWTWVWKDKVQKHWGMEECLVPWFGFA